MRKFIILTLVVFVFLYSCNQPVQLNNSATVPINKQDIQVEKKKERKVVTVTSGKLELYSVGRADLGNKKNKSTLKISLPLNTVEWCYVFRTKKQNESTSGERLFDNLMNLDPTLQLANMAIKTITGTGGVCNVYLSNEEYAYNFMQGKRLKHYTQYARENHSEGVVIVNDVISEDITLCFENEYPMKKVIIEYEIIAIVEE